MTGCVTLSPVLVLFTYIQASLDVPCCVCQGMACPHVLPFSDLMGGLPSLPTLGWMWPHNLLFQWIVSRRNTCHFLTETLSQCMIYYIFFPYLGDYRNRDQDGASIILQTYMATISRTHLPTLMNVRCEWQIDIYYLGSLKYGWCLL